MGGSKDRLERAASANVAVSWCLRMNNQPCVHSRSQWHSRSAALCVSCWLSSWQRGTTGTTARVYTNVVWVPRLLKMHINQPKMGPSSHRPLVHHKRTHSHWSSHIPDMLYTAPLLALVAMAPLVAAAPADSIEPFSNDNRITPFRDIVQRQLSSSTCAPGESPCPDGSGCVPTGATCCISEFPNLISSNFPSRTNASPETRPTTATPASNARPPAAALALAPAAVATSRLAALAGRRPVVPAPPLSASLLQLAAAASHRPTLRSTPTACSRPTWPSTRRWPPLLASPYRRAGILVSAQC